MVAEIHATESAAQRRSARAGGAEPQRRSSQNHGEVPTAASTQSRAAVGKRQSAGRPRPEIISRWRAR